MNKTVVFFLLILGIGLHNFSCQYNTAHAADKTTIDRNTIPFGFQIEVETLSENQYSLVSTIDLAKGDYTISPLSPDTFYMHVGVFLEETKNLIEDKTLVEIPASRPEIDPILNYPVHFVRGKTTYKKKLKVTTKDNFKINGKMEFLLEPICIPYQVEFVLANQSGKLEVKNVQAKIAPSYKGK